MLPIKIHFPRWLRTGVARFLTWLGHLRALWSIWDLRTLILVSLGLQVILIVIAPFRKRSANSLVVTTIWLSYLLADYIAIQAIGLIPNYSARSAANAAYATHPDLLAFWAPFLLVHLGGPDPITALALEDNELWLRTALHFFAYVSAIGRVFFQSLATTTNVLFFPTVLMLFAGLFKYLERTLSMYYARLAQVRASMQRDQDSNARPNYRKLTEVYNANRRFPSGADHSRIDIEKGERLVRNVNVKLVKDAFGFFNKYKGLYVDFTFNYDDWNLSRNYFLDPSLTPERAFSILEMELNFAYEVFFTKMIMIHQKLGITIRCAGFTFQVVSLMIWILFIDKQRFHELDIWITYTLLVGAVGIDLLAFLMVSLSDWQVAVLSDKSKIRASLYDKMLRARSRTWGSYWGRYDEGSTSALWQWTKRVFCRRWSESVCQHSMMDQILDPWSNSLLVFPPLKERWERFRYVSKKWFADELRDFIFEELTYKAKCARTPEEADKMCDSWGDWVLTTSAAESGFNSSVFLPWITDFEYDECLLIWHIATEILYHSHGEREKERGEGSNSSMKKHYRKYCKTLSDYMMYLFNWQPEMMSSVVGINIGISFRDICSSLKDTSAEATNFFERALRERGSKKKRLQTGCTRLMDVNTDIHPVQVKGNRSKSTLFECARLAKGLKMVEERSGSVVMWEIMAKVWVELLSYSASHCRATVHAAQLKQGGELLTLVWLLMVHLGLIKEFRATRRKLIQAHP